jgi:hypothetical protein
MVGMKPARRTTAVPDQRIVGSRVAAMDVAGGQVRKRHIVGSISVDRSHR